ncbi:hypothetical protein JTE90_007006 [Oedothorax gibbosus]|uniref:Uncharacterized protein n=1 Tax=Oedothorax gibbosus TaxID=931172 RepID=A0AAV6TW96_9ARAC|nr:hypothetical protein JTE90_007006 [Oedothorax gibbosus]
MLQRPDIETMRINGSVVELVKRRKSTQTFCCPLECFPIPDKVIRGLACWRCKAVNYCKCDCETWTDRFPRALKIYGPTLRIPPSYYHYDKK